ncbi:hypothetical protein ABPG74_001418 [Tetrahymena malaccensis]
MQLEDRNNSQYSVESLAQNNQGNNLPPAEGTNYIKKKFRRELYFVSITLSLLLLGTFLAVFIYYLKNKMLQDSGVLVPNKYFIKQASGDTQSVTLYAQYDGENSEKYANIYPNIVVKISLQNLKNNDPQDSVSYLQIDIQQYQGSNLKQSQQSGTKQTKDNQLILEDLDLGPFDLEFSSQGSKLAFIILRKSTNEKIFDTVDFDIIISQYYSTIGTIIPAGNFYGLGERRTTNFSFQKVFKDVDSNCIYGTCNKYKFWNRNIQINQQSFDDGKGNGYLSGYQPLYLIQEESNNYSLFYIDESYSGLEVDYYSKVPNTKNLEGLVFQSFSNKINFKIFLGDTNPQTVIKQYHSFIGKFNLIPFWALGYHHSKIFLPPFTKNIKKYLDYLQKLKIPIDALWTNFEISYEGNYYKILNQEIVDQLNQMRTEYHMKWIPQIPSEIPNIESCKQYVIDGVNLNTFIISNKTKAPYQAEGLFGKALFIDYNHVNSSVLVYQALQDLNTQIPFDGLWLSQNEPSTLVTGEFVNDHQLNKSNGEFDILNKYTDIQFNQNLLNTDALHYNKPDSKYFYKPESGDYLYERDLHSSNGFMQSQTIYKILKQEMNKQQPFIVSSSNRPGSGMSIAHSTGVALNSWEILQSSFTEIFNFQLFGIPFTGNNICPLQALNENDFPGVSELCTRWYQAASLFPFMHSTQTFTENDPFYFKDYAYLINSVKESLNLRYSLLKHYYSLYVFQKGTGMVFMPVTFVYPEIATQDYVLINSNNTAMIGESLYVFTVMTQGDQNTNTTLVYLGVPPQLWVNLLDPQIQFKGPFSTKYDYPFQGSPLIFLREGYLLLQQSSSSRRASLLDYSFTIKSVLTVVNQSSLEIQYNSQGRTLAVLDYNDGEALDKCNRQGCELKINMLVNSSNNKELDIIINFSSDDSQYFEEGIIIKSVQISGVVKYNDILLQYCKSGDIQNQPFDYITVEKQLTPENYFIVNQRQSTFNLKIAI